MVQTYLITTYKADVCSKCKQYRDQIGINYIGFYILCIMKVDFRNCDNCS